MGISLDTLPEFKAFPKIPRLHRRCVITEKVDGTNGQIIVLSDGTVHAASRNRYLRPDQPDNYGFRAWVEANAEMLKRLGMGVHYGEWYGSGIQRGYGLLNGEKRFALFNTSRYADVPKNTEGLVGVVPVLYDGVFDNVCVGSALEALTRFGSRIVPGYMRPEGIVIYHEMSGQTFKVTLENDEAPKGAPNA